MLTGNRFRSLLGVRDRTDVDGLRLLSRLRARRFSHQEEKLDTKLEIQKSKLVAAGAFNYDE